ncbi:MAG: hypothetical protein U0930_00700 [Pirellulales bacterium]
MACLRTTLAMLAVALATSLANAQQFTLSAPSLNITSRATLTATRLEVIDAQNVVNRYDRDAALDSADGQWLAYRSPQTGKILRWPVSNSGNLQIGTPQGGTVRYSASQMQIQATPGTRTNVGNRPNAGSVLPPSNGSNLNPGLEVESGGLGVLQETVLDYQGKQWDSFATSDLFTRVIANPANRLPNQQAIHLVSYDAGGTPWAVTQRGATLGCTSQVSSQAMWWVAPAGPGMVRLQMLNNGQVWAVSAAGRNNLRLDLVGQDPRQLWRVSHGNHGPRNQFILENAHFVGNYLSHLGRGALGMQPWLALPTQYWVPISPPPTYLTTLQPFWRNVNREIRPNPPLPPAEVELTNSHKNALMILVGDLRSGQVVKELRVEANQSTTITVERDPGSTLVEVVEVMTPGGGWNRQEFVTQIPPVSLYDLSVYEEFLQSIAIDRTGKSPNKIEDVNYQPKSVGLLVLPPGDALPERGQMDAFAQAKSADNAGAVRRMDSKRFEKPKADPLESILEGIQNKNPPTGGRSF